MLPEGVLITQSLIDSEMPELKQSQLGKILTRYYNRLFRRSRSNWNKINSYKVSAELNTVNGIQNYESIFKKPNFYKIVFSSEEIENIVAFDGNNKWQKQISGRRMDLSLKLLLNLQRMIHEPELSTYLLYPFQKVRFSI